MLYEYTKKEFILGLGYVLQPSKILTEKQKDEQIKKHGGIYQNEWYTPIN
jgi:hypothetical protein